VQNAEVGPTFDTRNTDNLLPSTSTDLHPPTRDESGISSALSWYMQGLAERSSLAIDPKVPENFGRLRFEMEPLILPTRAREFDEYPS
jgi:hypothetical protein